ncbi:alpha/beta hydrolase fold domain-containing protein [Burkholderia stagnalis]|uniref:Steryl acetyl hydrolase n=1 Tax=Burkholderia stagnalis TaxID=1503054 RepID=A0ABX9YIL1_9BURK|nr:alpha/beta hydrolase fold domain-containing protein [Burkholderia stagnalis]RQQ58901.1 steryl acetyl hydrolase [Burkholderia stagnalis]RQQ62803.1 steryl acetyl hydrolase [Burkholderia stagnalis]RQQ63940.1 steryl acetyl hydrolase [Burkholderia stagnalis]RQQ76927.1 steryl acetyl hydrolase [Burkholderia stagnalis]RQQ83553.1 steryl acetyl hydrolase [Burkholderia stagnalis]
MRSPESTAPDAAAAAAPLAAIIIGAGFAGIGMAIALQREGMHDFVILERAHDVGGVWRDNSYPGAACDVPSHLYSFSFEPNPRWSRTFAPQAEIHAYLQHCARKYGLARHLRFGAEVRHARYDEPHALWRVTLADGTELSAALLVSGTGQLSRPALPTLPGMETFRGHAFHSAHWDHAYPLAGKRVAVVGTGASAIQFVPAIAGAVKSLTVFQRSPAYLMPRSDRPYRRWEQALFRRLPWAMKLHRAAIYLRYESRAIAFTRLNGLMDVAVGRPFRKLLARQVPDAALRERLTPDYPIGCKRILLSSDYLAAIARPNVELVTQGIRRVTEHGIETADGTHHPVDAIVYGTGFAATEFLSPMRITGRGGLDLNDAWRRGAQAYLGMTVPGFPNFFMLYGPNTNLGHNSIVYMLESQIAHVMRCVRAMRQAGASAIDVDAGRYRRYNLHVQQRLAGSVWSGCKSWYVDASGHNSTNWPGFTLTYRWLARRSGLAAYRFSSVLPGMAGHAGGVAVAAPKGALEALNAGFLRGFLRVGFRALIGPPFGIGVQRRVVGLLAPLMPGVGGMIRYRTQAGGVPAEVVAPKRGDSGGAILYLHGGAFCVGGPGTHRSVTTRLADESGLAVWAPDYRLAPEHPHPAALDDALAAYAALRAQGHAPSRIVVAGDSAGGALALALAIALRERGEPAPAGLLLISPVTDAALGGETLATRRGDDPMIRRGWLEQGLRWYHGAGAATAHGPLDTDLRGLPPMLIQAGDQEVLLSDSVRLADHALACGVPCRLEVHQARWHVFHLQSFYLRSAREALRTLAGFARERVAATA